MLCAIIFQSVNVFRFSKVFNGNLTLADSSRGEYASRQQQQKPQGPARPYYLYPKVDKQTLMLS